MSKPTLDSDNDQPKNLLEELQASLYRRFSRAPQLPEPIVYEFTNDRALLHQYYRIREIMYRKVHNAHNMGVEDVYDKISHILIARRGKLVIGGCRLIVREADEDFLLPMESPDFKLRDLFPQLPLRKFRHGEISRFAVLDDDKDRLEIMRDLNRIISKKCTDLELGFGFFKSTLLMARNLRKVLSTYCGLNKIKICTEINVPESPLHPEIKLYISAVTLPASETMIETPYEDILVQSIDSLVH